MTNFCSLSLSIFSPFNIATFVAIFLAILTTLAFGLLGYLAFKKIKHQSTQAMLTVLFTLIYPVLLFMIFIGYIIFLEVADNRVFVASEYADLNAAIKNTCLLDPNKNHCPQTAQDIINIEPEKFANLTKNAHLTYHYYPETNQYTLIVRNSDDTAAIFDPRLASIEDYGLDFMDVKLKGCGDYTIMGPSYERPTDASGNKRTDGAEILNTFFTQTSLSKEIN